MNTNALEILLRALDDGRLPHGILLQGPDLGALEEVAQTVAARLLRCAPSDVRRHPDFFFVRPSGKSRQILITPMRELVRKIFQTPNAGDHKVAFVYEADRLSSAVSDTFLKTLEEPPADTTIFLLTTKPAKLSATVRSRCHHFRALPETAPPPDPEWEEWLDALDDWICDVAAPVRTDKTRAAGLIFTLYGLAARFCEILDTATKAAWIQAKTDLPDAVDSDELEAIEVGIQKGIRARRLADMSARLCTLYARAPSAAATRALHTSIQKLEQISGLFETNLALAPALEYTLIHWLRAWSTR